jgi:hypothetical protein
MFCSTTGVFSDNALHQGFGLAGRSIPRSGFSYIRNISEKITIQINGKIGGELGNGSWLDYDLSVDAKWNFHRLPRSIFYGVVSGGLGGNQQIAITSVNIGLGIGLSFAITPHVWCALDVKNTYFPMEKRLSFPMPQIAIHHWF